MGERRTVRDSVPTKAKPNRIKRISVEQLFGQFNYELPSKDEDRDLGNLFILYGDNGSGKTTLLRLVYHLLSHEDDKGHKTAVSKIRFRRFSVELSDGTIVEAFRSDSRNGPYRASVLKAGETVDSIDLPTDSQRQRVKTQNRLATFLRHLKEINIRLHLLSDDRRIAGLSNEEERWRIRSRQLMLSDELHFFDPVAEESQIRISPVKFAGEQVHRWINQQAYKGFKLGQTDVHSIYTSVAKHIVDARPSGDSQTDQQMVEDSISMLRELSQRSKDYSQFGLTPELPTEEMIVSLEKGSADYYPVLYKVLQPYIQSIEARLNALESVYKIIDTFVGNINGFLGGNKHARYHLRDGLTIHARNGEPLDLDVLSSGEKQLLLLLCNTLAARDEASVIIIDEPEISLNIKWQRGLIQALLDCIQGSDAQLIFATHSIELLAQHRTNVVKLTDLTPEPDDAEDEEPPHARRRETEDPRVGRPV